MGSKRRHTTWREAQNSENGGLEIRGEIEREIWGRRLELSGERRLIYGREVREERRQKLKQERKLLLDHAYILAAVNK